ncbi:MAG: transcription elongation factor GreA [Calditrichaeota bacterium]|nr:transcription elongation factor GreA [Calditrichota bacterium]
MIRKDTTKFTNEPSYLTHEGVKKLRAELDELVNKIRPVATADLAQAREKGDLSENAEYDAARLRLREIDDLIGELGRKFNNLHIIDESVLNSDEVRILSKVKIRNLKNNIEMEYTVVDPMQANPAKHLLSLKSPIVQGLLGKKVGDEAVIAIPSGEVTFKIISIEINEDL